MYMYFCLIANKKDDSFINQRLFVQRKKYIERKTTQNKCKDNIDKFITLGFYKLVCFFIKYLNIVISLVNMFKNITILFFLLCCKNVKTNQTNFNRFLPSSSEHKQMS